LRCSGSGFIQEALRRRDGQLHCRQTNGPEFIAHALRRWTESSGTSTAYIEPGSPWQNGFAESFNGRFRDEFLNTELFATVPEAQALADRWRWEYNTQEHRSTSSTGRIRPSRGVCPWRAECGCCITTHSHKAWTDEGGHVSPHAKHYYHADSRSISDRIVSLFQSHIRATGRGKAHCNTEFGAKISISVTGEGFTFLDRLSYSPYNE
jgi:hypothetical protein